MINWLEGTSWADLTLILAAVVTIIYATVIYIRYSLAAAPTEPPAPGDVSAEGPPPIPPRDPPVPGLRRFIGLKELYKCPGTGSPCFIIRSARGDITEQHLCDVHRAVHHDFARWECEVQP